MKTKTKLSAKAISELSGIPKNYAAKIAEIYNSLTPSPYWQITTEEAEAEVQNEKIKGTRFKVCHAHGSFSVFVPEKIAPYFFELFGISILNTEQQPSEVINLSQDLCKIIKKAAKFTGKDDFRPVLSGIFIEIEGGQISVTATDANTLYKSKPVNCDSDKKHAFIITGSFEGLGTVDSIEVCSDGVKLAGRHFAYVNKKYPNYKAVLPEYSGEMTFERKVVANTLKTLKSMQSRYAHTVVIYFNGCIQMTASDLDFENNATVKTPYKSKTFKDCEIGFNSKFLQKSLGAFQDNVVKLKTDGDPSKAVILDGVSEFVLCMPQILNK
jgi:DNA polymerase III sliding clamp (beta) subunit (PCNA family)